LAIDLLWQNTAITLIILLNTEGTEKRVIWKKSQVERDFFFDSKLCERKVISLPFTKGEAQLSCLQQ